MLEREYQRDTGWSTTVPHCLGETQAVATSRSAFPELHNAVEIDLGRYKSSGTHWEGL